MDASLVSKQNLGFGFQSLCNTYQLAYYNSQIQVIGPQRVQWSYRYLFLQITRTTTKWS
jgi:hypothetical protein